MKKETKQGAVVSEAPLPKPGPTELLVKTKAASICGTDAHIYNWDAWAQNRIKPPLIFGHEFCGEVIEVGSLVHGFAKGDFISAESHIPCGTCFQCRTNQMHICQNLTAIGLDKDGGFAEFVAVPQVAAWKNPKDLPPEIASIQEPLGNAVYAVLAEEVTGRSVAIFGCGPAGLFSVGVAAASGAYPVIAVIKHEFRRKIAEAMGATHVLRVGEKDIIADISKITHGQGVDAALEMTGAAEAIQQSFQVLKKGGRLSAFGIPNDRVSIDLAKDVIFRGIRIYGIYGRIMYDTWYKMQALLQSGKLNPTPVITHRFALAEFENGMKAMTAPDRRCGKVVLFP